MNSKVATGKKGIAHLKATFIHNRKLYLMEGFGLAIFMISACFFGALLEGTNSWLHHAIPNGSVRQVMMGVSMGLTALLIFYSPFTAPSGAHINPAVTMVFFRLGKISGADSFFYIIFQFAGGTLAVLIMQYLLGNSLVAAPVNSVATVPGKAGVAYAAITEFTIAFVMIVMVLFTAADAVLKKYTRIFAGCLVCCFVVFAGPVSGFGMNPARSFASAFPSGIYTAFWIYMLIPFAGMLGAAEFFLLIRSAGKKIYTGDRTQEYAP